jgi:PEP-CTERM motif
MKKILTTALLASTLFSGAAFAEKYDLLNDGANFSPLHNNYYTDSTGNKLTLMIETWCATLIANATGNSFLNGTFVGSDKKTYNINMTLSDSYFTANGFQHWGNFIGSVTGNGRNISLNDIVPTRDVASDAVLGINSTPYNNGQKGGNIAYMEFGFWGDDSKNAYGNRNSDANTHVACIADPAAGVTTNANGSCGRSNVPLPGTLALAGIAMLGLGLRRKLAAK